MATTTYTKKRKYASARVVQAQIDFWAEHDPAVLECRSEWHAWQKYTAIDNGKETAQVRRCEVCGGFKYRILNSRTGAVLKGWQTLLKSDYYMPSGAGFISQNGMNYVRLAAISAAAQNVRQAQGNIYDLVHTAIENDDNA
jgi:hypothetical protein